MSVCENCGHDSETCKSELQERADAVLEMVRLASDSPLVKSAMQDSIKKFIEQGMFTPVG